MSVPKSSVIGRVCIVGQKRGKPASLENVDQGKGKGKRAALGLTPPAATYRDSLPCEIPIPPTPRSPRPRTREPSVTTCVDEYEYVEQESGATLTKSVSDTSEKNSPDRVHTHRDFHLFVRELGLEVAEDVADIGHVGVRQVQRRDLVVALGWGRVDQRPVLACETDRRSATPAEG